MTEFTSIPRQMISIVVPVLNERGNLEAVCMRVEKMMLKLNTKYDFEIIFTDNHSEDGTFEELLRLARTRPYLRAIRFSKNVGYQLSILTGFLAARGSAAVQLDADLEDPPELIPEFIGRWEGGAQVVYGIREERSEPRLKTIPRLLFYRFLRSISSDYIPVDAGDFRLIDRCVIDQLSRIKDPKPYLRGIIASMGFQQVGVGYKRNQREWGESKFPYREMLRLGLDAVFNHSDLPLKLATRIGVIVSASSFLLGVVYLVGKLMFRQEWAAGFATTTILILLSLGVISLLLGIIGEYLSRIYLLARGYPSVVVEKEIKNTNK